VAWACNATRLIVDSELFLCFVFRAEITRICHEHRSFDLNNDGNAQMRAGKERELGWGQSCARTIEAPLSYTASLSCELAKDGHRPWQELTSQNAHAYTALLVTHQPRRRVFVYALSGVHAACRLSFVIMLEL